MTEKAKTFWDSVATANPNDARAMMLNANAHSLQEGDALDILDTLPSAQGMHVVDIGAGIGRFTAEFARQGAATVRSVDFVESFIARNRELNGHVPSVIFDVNCASSLRLPKESVDMVFTNWLLMYLSDAATIDFLGNVLEWLKPDGYLHLRESCSQPSAPKTKGDIGFAEDNPTYYRMKSAYLSVLPLITRRDGDGVEYRLQPVWARSVPTYIKVERNWRQCHMLVRKVRVNPGALGGSAIDVLGAGTTKRQAHVDSLVAEHRLRLEGRPAMCDMLDGNTDNVLVVNTRVDIDARIDPVNMAETTAGMVTSVDECPLLYRQTVSAMNEVKSSSMRAHWVHTVEDLHTDVIERAPFTTVYMSVDDARLTTVIRSAKKVTATGGTLVCLVTCENELELASLSAVGNVSVTRLPTKATTRYIKYRD